MGFRSLKHFYFRLVTAYSGCSCARPEDVSSLWCLVTLSACVEYICTPSTAINSARVRRTWSADTSAQRRGKDTFSCKIGLTISSGAPVVLAFPADQAVVSACKLALSRRLGSRMLIINREMTHRVTAKAFISICTPMTCRD